MTAIAFPGPLAAPRRTTGAFLGATIADDGLLVDAARRGDPDAWRALIQRHEAAVAAVVVGMLGAGDEADDVGQETFIRFYRALARFRGDASVRTYLHRIAVNLSLNALKRRKRGLQRFLPFEESDVATPAEMQIDPMAAQESQSNVDMVRAAIARLPELHRVVVILRMIEGYSTRETADILKVPEGTVLSRLARAIGQLRGLLGPLVEYSTTESHDAE